jgi:DNA replication licensing factor MCM2
MTCTITSCFIVACFTHFLAPLRARRTWHLGNLIKVRGVVTRRSGVFPQLSVVRWDCGRCGAVMGPFVSQGDDQESIKPKMCVACQAKGPFNVSR